jgi:hypothetical protein
MLALVLASTSWVALFDFPKLHCLLIFTSLLMEAVEVLAAERGWGGLWQ